MKEYKEQSARAPHALHAIKRCQCRLGYGESESESAETGESGESVPAGLPISAAAFCQLQSKYLNLSETLAQSDQKRGQNMHIYK